MSKSLLFIKISNVGYLKLIKIIWYKILYLFLILFEKTKLKLFSKNTYLKPINTNKNFKFLNNPDVSKLYYNFCTNKLKVIENADNVLNNKIILFGKRFIINETEWLKDPISGKSWYGECFFKDAKVENPGYGDVKYVMELNKMGFLVELAHAYYITCDEKYTHKINDYLIGWMNTIKHERSVVNKSMLDISFRCINLIHISMLCFKSDYFLNNTFDHICAILTAYEHQISKFSTPRWCKYNSGLNHTIGEISGLIITQLWLQQFTNKQYNHNFKKEFKYLQKSLDQIITANGVYFEQSSHYSKLVAEFLMLLDVFIKLTNSDDTSLLYNNKYLKSILQYLKCLSFNNKLPNFGDNDGAKVAYPFYDDEYSISHLIKYQKIFDPYTGSCNYLLCKESGQFIWKSEESKQVFVFIRCGNHSYLPIGSGSHAHNDILSLILSIDNEELFIDHGTYFYNSGVDILNNDRLTSNHNTVSINKTEQAPFAGKWMYGSYPLSKIIEEKTVINKSSFVFSGVCSYSGKTHVRSIEYNNQQMVLIDDIECGINDIVSINFLLSSMITVKIISESDIELYNKKDKVATMSFGKSIKFDVIKAHYYPSYGIKKETIRIIGTSEKKGNQRIKTIISFK